MTAVQLTPEQAKAIGDVLKSARESQSKSIPEVAYQIALSPAQLRAIESADLKPFYSPSFFYQAAQRYAALLNATLPVIDVPVALDVTPAPTQDTPKTIKAVEEPPRKKVSAERKSLGWKPLVLAAGAAAIGVGVMINLQSATKMPAESASTTPAIAAPASTTPVSEPASAPGTPATAAAVPSNPPIPAPAPNANAIVANTQASGSEQTDSVLESAVLAWVQIVKKNGEKNNIKIQPGQKIEFASVSTAAIVFGQPDKARLLVKGKAVDLNRFVTADNPPRALVILNQIQ